MKLSCVELCCVQKGCVGENKLCCVACKVLCCVEMKLNLLWSCNCEY